MKAVYRRKTIRDKTKVVRIVEDDVDVSMSAGTVHESAEAHCMTDVLSQSAPERGLGSTWTRPRRGPQHPPFVYALRGRDIGSVVHVGNKKVGHFGVPAVRPKGWIACVG